MIKNYLLPNVGISGPKSYGRAATQAQKFGAKVLIANNVTAELRLAHERAWIVQTIRARSTSLPAAQYNVVEDRTRGQLEGQGIYYGATH